MNGCAVNNSSKRHGTAIEGLGIFPYNRAAFYLERIFESGAMSLSIWEVFIVVVALAVFTSSKIILV
ncbi:MAG: hypothetical protein OEW58_08345 [Gammaproteobacteria bacterium]|nr:hypothetical protein [Gammaproteobacteria bacterium]